ncbi:MAG: proline iminopeptidase-family hydrolase [Holophagales bacterium]|nr:proline iminopeptidase-family hydrolase [Holophagales bacterium]
MRYTLTLVLSVALVACAAPPPPPKATSAPADSLPTLAQYFDDAGRADAVAGGERMIPIQTPKGEFRVWTRRVGNNPKVKVLVLHGGPGFSHEYLEGLDTIFPKAGVEYYMYDQLGSGCSDKPEEPELWEIPRFVDEVEQVRVALGLGPENFVLYGQSWGGALAIEYALAHPGNLKGMVISNMMSSIPAYNVYAHDVLQPAMDPAALAEILAIEAKKDYANPRYEELLMGHFYNDHILRLPMEQWPAGLMRDFTNVNHEIYVSMQGPSEMGASGKLENWDRSGDLAKIGVPTLVIGATHDTMDPKHMEWMAGQFPKGRFLLCPNGSHLALYDDREVYAQGLNGFLTDLAAGRF